MSPAKTMALGIFQSDLIIRSALLKGLQNMRAKPWLLDYCFASLPQDEVTAKEYGQKTVDAAKEWFTQQEVAVFLNTRVDNTKFPAISITLSSSAEDDASIGDVHYEPQEDCDLQWPTLYGPFSSAGYDYATGQLTLPLDAGDKLILAAGMLVIDDAGDMHQIVEVVEDNVVVIAKGITNSMQKASVKAPPPAFTAAMESVLCRETYSLGVHVGGEVEHLIWLHSVVVFILLAYKETLLEARNFERSSISSSDAGINPNLSGETERVLSRYITLSGYVRQMWPKSIKQKITSTQTGITASQHDVLDGVVVDITPNTAPGLPVVYVPPSTANDPILYWGAALVSRSTGSVRQRVNSFDAPTGAYGYYLIPNSFGGTPSSFIDADTGFEVGVSKVTTITIGSVVYAAWRTNQPGLGPLEIEVQ